MDYNVSATRLTLYAFISCIEIDLRNFIIDNISESNQDFIFNQELILKLKDRSRKNGSFESFEDDPINLIEYLDFGDCVELLNKFKKIYPKSFQDNIEKLSRKLEETIPIRNRVMHSRPLEYEDLPTITDFVDILQKYDFIKWNQTLEMRDKIREDPSNIFGLKIPKLSDYQEDRVLHNLPGAEFDDTGFIGRKEERIKIKDSLLHSSYPVISIVGDGGVGKTALVLRCLYDIIDEPEQPFEAIIWVSLKTKVLNNGEFVNIKNAINNTLDMYKEISSSLIGGNEENVDEIIKNIIEYMENFNILLALDNLETINSEMIRDFLKKIPKGSKVVITSRIGIGEFEYRERLEGLGKNERVYYLKRLAKIYKLMDILRLDDLTLDQKICLKLHSNPLAIKWFIINLLKGEPMESILNHTEILTDYCMSNVYEKLSQDAKTVLEVLLIANKKCSDAELDYLLGLDSIMHRKALNELVSTNMVKMESETNNNEVKTLFYISDFAREYLQQHCKPTNTSFMTITKKIRQLEGLTQTLDIQNEVNPYDPKSIIVENQDEKIAAYYLRQALVCSSKEDYNKAFECIEKAKNAVPNYFEIYKISGFIHAGNKDYFIADKEYMTAIECKPNFAPLLFLYAGFKLCYVGDFEGALEDCIKAEKLDNQNINIKMQKGRILKQLNRYEEADFIFQDILYNNSELKTKEKKITVDQAADNLRRWAEKAIREENYPMTIKLLSRAIGLVSLLNESDIDYKIITTVSKIIKTTTYTCVNSNVENKDGINLLVDMLNKYQSKLFFNNKYNDSQESIKNLFPSLTTETRNRLEPYVNTNLNELLKSIKNENEGYVIKKQKNYGFIISRKYQNGLFFFWEDVKSDFSRLSIGDKVKFEISTNEKGECARNVIVIDKSH